MTTISRTEDDLDFGLIFTEGKEIISGVYEQRYLVLDQTAATIIGERPVGAGPSDSMELGHLIWAIDALAWLVKREIAEMCDNFVGELPQVRVGVVHPEALRALTVDGEIVLNNNLDPLAAMTALLEHVRNIHIATARADDVGDCLVR